MKKVAIILNPQSIHEIIDCYHYNKEAYKILVDFVSTFKPKFLLPFFDQVLLTHIFYNPGEFEKYTQFDPDDYYEFSNNPYQIGLKLSTEGIRDIQYQYELVKLKPVIYTGNYSNKDLASYWNYLGETYRGVFSEYAESFIFIGDDNHFLNKSEHYNTLNDFIYRYCREMLQKVNVTKIIDDFKEILKSKPELIQLYDLKADDCYSDAQEYLGSYDDLLDKGVAEVEIINKGEIKMSIDSVDFDIYRRIYIELEVFKEHKYIIGLSSPINWSDELLKDWSLDSEVKKYYETEESGNNRESERILEEMLEELESTFWNLQLEGEIDVDFNKVYDELRSSDIDFNISYSFKLIIDYNKIVEYEIV